MIVFFTCGIIILLIDQITDAWYFFTHLYRWKVPRVSSGKMQQISYTSFQVLERILKNCVLEMHKHNSKMVEEDFMKHSQATMDSQVAQQKLKEVHEENQAKKQIFISNTTMKTTLLIHKVRIGLGITQQIRMLIFGKEKVSMATDDAPAAVRPKSLQKQDDLPGSLDEDEKLSCLERIKIFNMVKKIILRSSTEDDSGDKIINIKLFEGLVREIRLRLRVECNRAKNKGTSNEEKMETMYRIMQDYALINPVKILEALSVS